MSRFVQFHLITSYPPSNLNRDDLGRPKSAMMGGVSRLRISSQCLKRTWRQSDVVQKMLEGYVGTRTRRLGDELLQRLLDGGWETEVAARSVNIIVGAFGAVEAFSADKPQESVRMKQLAHFGPDESKAAHDFVAYRLRPEGERADEGLNKLWEQIEEAAQGSEDAEEDGKGKKGKKAKGGDLEGVLKELRTKVLKHRPSAVDIALFGRMYAAATEYNVDAAAQVAHAITVHDVAIEDDYFTAVDDLNTGEEDLGAGHIGEVGFGAGVFYLYVCVDRATLVKNLQGDEALAGQALKAMLEAAATVAPSGKQNSFGSRAAASYVLVEQGDQQPRSLSAAFLKPVKGKSKDMVAEAVERLQGLRSGFEKAYGPMAAAHKELCCAPGIEGERYVSLAELLKFVEEGA